MRRDDERLADILKVAEKVVVRSAKGRQACWHILATEPLPPTITPKVYQRDYVGAVTSDDDRMASS